MEQNARQCAKTCYFHMRRIRQLRRLVDRDTLHTLETMKSGRRAAGEETITVVQSSEDQRTDKRMQGVSVHEPAKLTDATHVKVACLRTLPGILLH